MADDKKYYMMGWNVVKSTHDKYLKAVKKFIEWYDKEWDDDDDINDPNDINQFDILLLQYIHYCYEEGISKSIADTALYGIKHFLPSLKDGLPRSSQALLGWKRKQPTQSYPPISYELTLILAYQMCRANKYEYGIGTLLSFDCLLRVSELCNIQRKHIHDSLQTKNEYKGMVLIIPFTKNGKNQHVTIYNKDIQSLIRILMKDKKSNDKVFSFTSKQFRSVFKQFIKNLNLNPRYVPHSLRHGGATRFRHVLNWSVENVLERGRWQSISSARRYIQSGKAIILSDEVPHSYNELGDDLSKNILFYFRRYLPQTKQ
jgi:integrase